MNWKKMKKNMSKRGKQAGKTYAKASKWINKNINPDLLSGNYGMGGSGGDDLTIRGIDWESELYGTRPRSVHHSKKKHSKKRSSGGKTITIKLE